MLVWTAGMNFIGRPLSYASVKLRPFPPVSPTFLPQSFSASLIFLFSPVVQRALLRSEENYKTLGVPSVFPLNSHSNTFLLFLPPPLPVEGEGLLDPFLGVHHFWLQNINCDHATVCHVTTWHFKHSGPQFLRSGDIWESSLAAMTEPAFSSCCLPSLTGTGHDRTYSIMVHYKLHTTA